MMTSLSLVRHILARPAIGFDAVTSAEGIAQWWGESRVEIRLRPIPEGTELTFTHGQLQDEEMSRGHEDGWTGALNKLEARFDSGTKS